MALAVEAARFSAPREQGGKGGGVDRIRIRIQGLQRRWKA